MAMLPGARVLVVDDDRSLLEALVGALQSMGFEVVGESEPDRGLARVGSWQPDVALFDLNMPRMNGEELTIQALRVLPDLPVILLTGFGTIQGAVHAMRIGAYDYLTKPFDLLEIELTLQKALDHREQRRRYHLLAETMGRVGEFGGIVGDSAAVRRLKELIAAVAGTDSTVLVTGESGSGKELVAGAVHTTGVRHEKPFVTVDCAAIPDTLLESELFGHVKGAFTGAHKDRAGYFEAAVDGTVFLDEIGEIPLLLQKKLLRVLEQKTFTRVGESRQRETRARIVAATNRNLGKEVEAGRFREDLFYRLNVIEIPIPPLRERVEDIPVLVHHYLHRLNRKLNRTVESVSPAALDLLIRYQWPGNVRELVHLLEQVMTFHNLSVLSVEHLPRYLTAAASQSLPAQTYHEFKEELLREAGRRYFTALLVHFQGNITQVADYAGVNRRHIHRLLLLWGLDSSAYRDN
jgi:DNA-binding NtrC family response regulator